MSLGARMTPRGRSALTIAFVVAVSAGVWVHRVHVDGPTVHAGIVQSDAFRYFYPTAVFIHDELAAGRLPLWNPFQMAGQPMAALPIPGALYPPNLLCFGLLGPLRGTTAHAILHLIVAGTGAWLLGRRLGLSRAAAVTSACGFSLSGALLLGAYIPGFLSSQAWLPWMLACIHGLLRDDRWRWPVGLAACLALVFLSGNPQVFVYTVQLGLVFGAVGLGLWLERARAARVALRLLAAAVLTVAWAGPGLFPGIEFLQSSVRNLEGLPLIQASRPHVQWPDLLRSMLRFGPEGGTPPAEAIANRMGLPMLFVPLLIAGLFARRLRAVWIFFAVVTALTALLAVGPQSPVFPLYYRLPLGDVFRAPLRWAGVYVLAASLLVGIGVDGAARLARRRLGDRLPPAVGRVALLVLCGLVVADDYARTELRYTMPVASPRIPGTSRAVLAKMLELRGRGRLFSMHPGLYSTSFLEKAGMLHRIEVASDYEPSSPGAYAEFFGVPDNSRLSSMEHPWHGALTVLREAQHNAVLVSPRVLDLMSARLYAIPTVVGPDAIARLEEVVDGGPAMRGYGVTLVERPQALRRAYAVRRVERAWDPREVGWRAAAGEFDPRRTVLLVDAPEAVYERFAEAEEGGRPDRVDLFAHEPQRVELRASCGRPCVAVLTDLHDPAWRVTIDGRPGEILRANGIFRGVVLEAGEHTIVYEYASTTLRAGAATAGLATLAVAGGFALKRRRRRAPG